MHYSGDRKRPTDALPMLKFFLGDPDNWRIGTSKVGHRWREMRADSAAEIGGDGVGGGGRRGGLSDPVR